MELSLDAVGRSYCRSLSVQVVNESVKVIDGDGDQLRLRMKLRSGGM